MFHRVCPEVKRTIPASVIEITPEYFKQVINFFTTQGYSIVPIGEVPRLLSSSDRTNRFVVFTFDDGYIDNYTTVYPILKKHNIPFTIYVSTDFPDRQAVLWWYMLEELVQKNDRLDFTTIEGHMQLECRTLEEKILAAGVVRRLLKFSNPKQFSTIVDSLFKKHDIDPLVKVNSLAMSWSQIVELSKDPLVTIGAHSVHHYPLNLLELASAQSEILDSRRIIQERISKKVDHFAYPFGGRNEAGEREFGIVKNAGFITATTSRMANLFHAHARHLESLPRLDVPALQDLDTLNAALDGYIPARKNRLKRVITE